MLERSRERGVAERDEGREEFGVDCSDRDIL
jgi:hypothetical protein